MTKKIALILAGLSLCLTACGGEEEDTRPNNTTTVATGNQLNGTSCTSHAQCASQFCRTINNVKVCADKLAIGSPCTKDDICVSGSVCKEETVGGALKCMSSGSSTTQDPGAAYLPGKNEKCTDKCNGNLICEPFMDGFSYCRVPGGEICRVASDCIKGYECKEDGAQYRCMSKYVGLGAECSDNCESNMVCEPSDDGLHSYCKKQCSLSEP